MMLFRLFYGFIWVFLLKCVEQNIQFDFNLFIQKCFDDAVGFFHFGDEEKHNPMKKYKLQESCLLGQVYLFL